ncbi:MAG TPA: hypothetical protein VNH18_04955, partial [Bryobacteraceae bacterium]|nr:hypothetical protein [Bryobacteraceae bacterium]
TSDLATAEFFDPAAGRSEPLPSMAVARRNHIAIRPAGADDVLLASGSCNNTECDSAEIFDPAVNKFAPATELKSTEAKAIKVTVASIDASGKPRRVRTWLLSHK